MKSKYARSLNKLLRCCPELENVTQEKHKVKGTIVLLNKGANRKYYIFKSGFAKAVNADYGGWTDFINAWSCDWRNCYPYSKGMLFSILHQYIEYHRKFKRSNISNYDVERKGEEEKVWSSIQEKWIPRSHSMWS